MRGKFADGIDSWRKIIASGVDAAARLVLFKNAAADVAGYVARGLTHADGADALQDIAEAHGLVGSFGADEIQRIIADAFDNGEIVPDDLALKTNGDGKAHTGPDILSKARFMRDFHPPNYLIDGMLQRRFLYSLTGQTGHAKSAIALLLSELVSSASPNAMLGRHRVEKGQVAYFVGENPDDIRMRVIGADSFRSDDPLQDRIVFIPGMFNIGEMFASLHVGLAEYGNFDLVIVDTSAAYFLGNEELSNTQMGAHARMLRTLTTLPGGPCVLVLCHPIKHVTEPSQLLPRGGGAFLNETDGNLTAWKHDDVLIDLHHNKIRGPGFEPIAFKLETIRTQKLVDAKNRMIPTVRAVVISQSEEDLQALQTREDEERVLAARLKVAETDDLSLADAAKMLGWTFADGAPARSRVQKTVDRLAHANPALIRKDRGRWFLTEKGKEAARKAALRLLTLDETRDQRQAEMEWMQ